MEIVYLEKLMCLQACHVEAAINPVHHSMAIAASLPLLLLGQVEQFLVATSTCILGASHVRMPWRSALRTKVTVTCEAAHQLSLRSWFRHESRTILERAVHSERVGNGSFPLSGHENLQLRCWDEFSQPFDIEVFLTVLLRAFDLRASVCKLFLCMLLEAGDAVGVCAPCHTLKQL